MNSNAKHQLCNCILNSCNISGILFTEQFISIDPNHVSFIVFFENLRDVTKHSAHQLAQ